MQWCMPNSTPYLLRVLDNAAPRAPIRAAPCRGAGACSGACLTARRFYYACLITRRIARLLKPRSCLARHRATFLYHLLSRAPALSIPAGSQEALRASDGVPGIQASSDSPRPAAQAHRWGAKGSGQRAAIRAATLLGNGYSRLWLDREAEYR